MVVLPRLTLVAAAVLRRRGRRVEAICVAVSMALCPEMDAEAF